MRPVGDPDAVRFGLPVGVLLLAAACPRFAPPTAMPVTRAAGAAKGRPAVAASLGLACDLGEECVWRSAAIETALGIGRDADVGVSAYRAEASDMVVDVWRVGARWSDDRVALSAGLGAGRVRDPATVHYDSVGADFGITGRLRDRWLITARASYAHPVRSECWENGEIEDECHVNGAVYMAVGAGYVWGPVAAEAGFGLGGFGDTWGLISYGLLGLAIPFGASAAPAGSDPVDSCAEWRREIADAPDKLRRMRLRNAMPADCR
jgi:hypothetical protein